jgi:hypothetical protein
MFLYAALRIPIDVFREYPTSLLGLATGQSLNIATAAAGAGLVAWSLRRRAPAAEGVDRAASPAPTIERPLWWRRVAFALLAGFALVIPSDWTQDVPERYGARHPGLEHSWLYPDLPAEARDPG